MPDLRSFSIALLWLGSCALAPAATPASVAVAAPGDVRVDLQGISKDGSSFGEVGALNVSTPAATEYFYNEMTIPVGADQPGSYFMANGFRAGYFGIQANAPTERWILFSVWDVQNGERTTLVRKGEGVVDNNFGGEGTGGQSHLPGEFR